MLYCDCAWRHINSKPCSAFCSRYGVRQRRKTRMQNRAFSLGRTMEEVWKDIPGYEGRYQVSDQGRVRSLTRVVVVSGDSRRTAFSRVVKGRLLSPAKLPTKHCHVQLGDGNTQYVHRLVLLTFVGAPPLGKECLHADDDPTNNSLANLRWGTRRENVNDATIRNRNGKLTSSEVIYIREARKNYYKGQVKDLAARFGVTRVLISRVQNRRRYAHV